MNRRPFALAIVLCGLALLPRSASADLLIANVGSNSILRYNPSANTLSTFSSGDNGALSVPHGMTYGPDGNLYVSSLGTGTIVEYNGSTGVFMGTLVPHTVGAQTLQYPNGIAFDPNNARSLYIASYYDNAIEKYDTVAPHLDRLRHVADDRRHRRPPPGSDGPRLRPQRQPLRQQLDAGQRQSDPRIQRRGERHRRAVDHHRFVGLGHAPQRSGAVDLRAVQRLEPAAPDRHLVLSELGELLPAHHLRRADFRDLPPPASRGLAGEPERAGGCYLRPRQRPGHHHELPRQLADQRQYQRHVGTFSPSTRRASAARS